MFKYISFGGKKRKETDLKFHTKSRNTLEQNNSMRKKLMKMKTEKENKKAEG